MFFGARWCLLWCFFAGLVSDEAAGAEAAGAIVPCAKAGSVRVRAATSKAIFLIMKCILQKFVGQSIAPTWASRINVAASRAERGKYEQHLIHGGVTTRGYLINTASRARRARR